MIWTEKDAADLQERLKAEFVSVRLSTLGGVDRARLMILVVLDPRSTWADGIMENSRYARFHASSPENKVELFSGGCKLPKFRKADANTLDKLAQKIQKWIDSANAPVYTEKAGTLIEA